ncbi:MAG: serine/threonine protein kinase [Haloarculaceae archaeon]|jgi:serine/threonine protein kinase
MSSRRPRPGTFIVFLIAMLVLIAFTGPIVSAASSGYISGKVTNENNEVLPGATVRVVATDTGDVVTTTTTNQDGEYTVGVEPGDYRVEAEYNGETGSATATVSEGETVIKSIVIIGVSPESPTGEITGDVVNENIDALPGATVRLIGSDSGDVVATTTAGDYGSYVFQEVETGDYLVEAEFDGETGSNTVTVSDGTNTADIVISGVSPEPATGSISGVVTDEYDEALSDATVRLVNSSTGTVVTTTTTTQDGSYTFPDVEVGEYTVDAEYDSKEGTTIVTVSEDRTSTANIVITGLNSAPIADAGSARTVSAGETITLEGTGSSDPDGDSLSYYWNATGGTITDRESATPTFTAPDVTEQTTVLVSLQVSDGNGGSDTDSIEITVDPGNQAPTADAGPDQTVTAGDSVTLDGTGSTDPDGDTVTYSWVQTSGPSVSVADSNSATPEFTAPDVDSERTLTFELTVDDGNGGSDTASTEIIVSPGNQGPTADAGADRTVNPGESLSLFGTGSSDPDDETLTYSWIQTEGQSVALVDSNTVTPEFTAPEVDARTTLAFEVTVEDEHGASDTDVVEITVVPETQTATPTKTPTQTPAPTPNPTETPTPTPTPNPTGTPTPTPTPNPTETPTPTPTSTSSQTPTPTSTKLPETTTTIEGSPPTHSTTAGSPPATSTTSSPPTTSTREPPQSTTMAGGGASGGNNESEGSEIPWLPIGLGTLGVVAGGAVWRRYSGSDDDGSNPATDSGTGSADDSTASRDQGMGQDGEGFISNDDSGSDGPDRSKADRSSSTPGGQTGGSSAPEVSDGSEQHASDHKLGSPGATIATEAFTYGAIEKGEYVGGGGNADVYRGTVSAPHGRVEVALKEPRIQGTITTERVDRILSEADTWHKLDDHEHVVDVLGWGSEPLPWIAMEYMDGGNLEAALPLEYDRTVEVLLSVAEAVEYAHRAGVAHGDIKPANVLFTGDPGVGGVAKVGDWGLAKELLEHSQSTEGLSPAYAAPEQFEGGSRDVVGPQLTDIYQLGALAYRTMTGRPPFEGTPFEIMNRVQSDRPTPPTEVNPSLPESVDEVVLTAMAKEPADRYETMTDFRRPLERL